MFRWGAVFWNGVKLWKLRQWRWIRQYRIIWFRIPWIWAANHLALHESCLKGSVHTGGSSRRQEEHYGLQHGCRYALYSRLRSIGGQFMHVFGAFELDIQPGTPDNPASVRETREVKTVACSSRRSAPPMRRSKGRSTLSKMSWTRSARELAERSKLPDAIPCGVAPLHRGTYRKPTRTWRNW